MKLLRWLLLFPVVAWATVVPLQWVNPTTYQPPDNQTPGASLPASAIVSTTIEFGTCTNTVPQLIGTLIGSFSAVGSATSVNSPDLVDGTYCFEAITNTATAAGVPSNAVAATVAHGLSTAASSVYLVTQIPDGWAFTAVGTVPIGTHCDSTQAVNGYNVVPQAGITVNWTSPVHPLAIVGSCH